jgi:hypothetical protein
MKKCILLLLLIPALVKAQYMAEVKSAVSFIYIQDSLGNPIPNGTCFFIGIKSEKDSLVVYPYLVTAKHVLQKKDGSFLTSILVRMNTIDSNSKFTYEPLLYDGPNKNVYLHPDSSIDLAVIPYIPPKKDYLFKFLDQDFLKDRKAFQSLPIEEGTEVFFTGLFAPYVGEKMIYPIVRFGRVSLITDEKVDWIGLKREMMLIETSSFGGNSGSPVYFKVGDFVKGFQLILGGVLNGTYRDAAEIKMVPTGSTPVAIYNNGISGITPVYLLRDIIYSKALIDERKKH